MERCARFGVRWLALAWLGSASACALVGYDGQHSSNDPGPGRGVGGVLTTSGGTESTGGELKSAGGEPQGGRAMAGSSGGQSSGSMLLTGGSERNPTGGRQPTGGLDATGGLEPTGGLDATGGLEPTGGVPVGGDSVADASITDAAVEPGEDAMVVDARVPFDAGGDVDAGSGDAGIPPVQDASTPVDSGMVDAAMADSAMGDAGPGPDATVPEEIEGLATRYDFSGDGYTVTDLSGGANAGLAGGAVLTGNGRVTLNGTGAHVQLPSGLLSQHFDATLMIWVTWHGGSCDQHLFDFGATTGFTLRTLYATPSGCESSGVAHTRYDGPEAWLGSDTMWANSGQTVGEMTQVTVIIDDTSDQLRYLIDGVLVDTDPLLFDLSDITDSNNSLGDTQYGDGRYLNADIHEFRVYDRALSTTEVQDAFTRGPDVP